MPSNQLSPEVINFLQNKDNRKILDQLLSDDTQKAYPYKKFLLDERVSKYANNLNNIKQTWSDIPENERRVLLSILKLDNFEDNILNDIQDKTIEFLNEDIKKLQELGENYKTQYLEIVRVQANHDATTKLMAKNQGNDIEYTDVVVWDFDDTLNENSGFRERELAKERKDQHYYISKKEHYDIYIPNALYLKATLDILHNNNVKSIVASQRNTYYLVPEMAHLREEMFGAFDRELGKDRPYLTENDVNLITAEGQGLVHQNDKDKNWILERTSILPGCNNIGASHKTLIDDDPGNKYGDAAVAAGYTFVKSQNASSLDHMAAILVQKIPADKLYSEIFKYSPDRVTAEKMLGAVIKYKVENNLNIEGDKEIAKILNFKNRKTTDNKPSPEAKEKACAELDKHLLTEKKFIHFLSEVKQQVNSMRINNKELKTQHYRLTKLAEDSFDIKQDEVVIKKPEAVKAGSQQTPAKYIRDTASFMHKLNDNLKKEKPSFVTRMFLKAMKPLSNEKSWWKTMNEKVNQYDKLSKVYTSLDMNITSLLATDYCAHNAVSSFEGTQAYQNLKSTIQMYDDEMKGIENSLSGDISLAAFRKYEEQAEKSKAEKVVQLSAQRTEQSLETDERQSISKNFH